MRLVRGRLSMTGQLAWQADRIAGVNFDREIHVAGWVLRVGERELVGADGVAVPLSTGEYNLLHAFVTHPKRVLTRDQLLDLSQGRELAAFERSIDNHISRLRRKIEADPSDPKLIKTIWGGGYTLAAEVKRL